jgi:hypothetical protein
MRIIRLIYFHIYNSYYKDGNYTNDIPHLTAFGIVGCSVSIISLSAIFTVYQLIFDKRLTTVMVVVPFVMLLACLFYLLMYDSKYKAIYSEFKGSESDTVTIKILSWSVLVIAFVLIGLYAYIFNQPK